MDLEKKLKFEEDEKLKKIFCDDNNGSEFEFGEHKYRNTFEIEDKIDYNESFLTKVINFFLFRKQLI